MTNTTTKLANRAAIEAGYEILDACRRYRNPARIAKAHDEVRQIWATVNYRPHF